MGASRQGSSSGLHHDYHDNFYLLLRGKKRFRLYSPDCAPFMYAHGDIEKVHPNGLISYLGNETRADGVPCNDMESNGDVDAQSRESDDSDSDDEEEGVFFGKGFDYKSDSESTHCYDGSKDDFDEMMAQGANSDSTKQASVATEPLRRPNSFSKIDVETLEKPQRIADKFPKFADCREIQLTLGPGQTLFVPCGWFHEVTSGSERKESNHTALNYWYHPPDVMDNFQQPYKHRRFWKEQAESRT